MDLYPTWWSIGNEERHSFSSTILKMLSLLWMKWEIESLMGRKFRFVKILLEYGVFFYKFNHYGFDGLFFFLFFLWLLKYFFLIISFCIAFPVKREKNSLVAMIVFPSSSIECFNISEKYFAINVGNSSFLKIFV